MDRVTPKIEREQNEKKNPEPKQEIKNSIVGGGGKIRDVIKQGK